MNGSSHRFRGESGVSLVELLVVCVVIAIVAALAFMQRGTTNEKLQRQNAARELKVAFERARFDSVKRRADSAAIQAYVEVTDNGFTLRVDRDQNGTLDSADDQPYGFPAGIVAKGFDFGAGTTIRVTFNQRGEPGVVGGGNPFFQVCNGSSCPAVPGNAAMTNTVALTPTGTVNLLPGGVSLPTFTNPPITTVPGGTDIRDDVVLPP